MAKRYQNKDWKRAMTIRLDYNNMMREFIGDEGITREELVAYRKSADKALGKLESEKGKGWLGWMDLPLHQREVGGHKQNG